MKKSGILSVVALAIISVLAGCGRNVVRGGQKIDNTVKKALDSDVLQGGAAEHGKQASIQSALPEDFQDQVLRDILSCKVKLRNLVRET